MRRLTQRGQATAEYALIVAVILGAFVAMSTYVKRGMQGNIKRGVDAVNNVDGGGVMGPGVTQYEPYFASQDYDTARAEQLEERLELGDTGRAKASMVIRQGQQAEGDFTQAANDQNWQNTFGAGGP